MISPEWVSAIGTCVQALLIVGSFVFIWIQIRDIKRGMTTQLLQNYWNSWILIDQWFADRPELRPFFYKGQDIDSTTSGELIQRLEACAEMFLDCFSGVYQQTKLSGSQADITYHAFMHNVYRTQPFFRRFVDENKSWYNKPFISFLTHPPVVVLEEHPSKATIDK